MVGSRSVPGSVNRSVQADSRRVRMRQAHLATALLLLTQLVLGMVTNLYVTIPSRHMGRPSNYSAGSARSIGWAIPNRNLWLAAHASLGLALVVRGLITLGVAVRHRARTALANTVAGRPQSSGRPSTRQLPRLQPRLSSRIMAGLPLWAATSSCSTSPADEPTSTTNTPSACRPIMVCNRIVVGDSRRSKPTVM